jgi:hypothetical protein
LICIKPRVGGVLALCDASASAQFSIGQNCKNWSISVPISDSQVGDFRPAQLLCRLSDPLACVVLQIFPSRDLTKQAHL